MSSVSKAAELSLPHCGYLGRGVGCAFISHSQGFGPCWEFSAHAHGWRQFSLLRDELCVKLYKLGLSGGARQRQASLAASCGWEPSSPSLRSQTARGTLGRVALASPSTAAGVWNLLGSMVATCFFSWIFSVHVGCLPHLGHVALGAWGSRCSQCWACRYFWSSATSPVLLEDGHKCPRAVQSPVKCACDSLGWFWFSPMPVFVLHTYLCLASLSSSVRAECGCW